MVFFLAVFDKEKDKSSSQRDQKHLTWFIFFWINNLTLICQKYTNNVLDFQIFHIHKNKMKIRWAELPNKSWCARNICFQPWQGDKDIRSAVKKIFHVFVNRAFTAKIKINTDFVLGLEKT